MKKGLIGILIAIMALPMVGKSQVAVLSIDQSGRISIPPTGVNLEYLEKESVGIYLDSTWTNAQIFYPNRTSKFIEEARFNILENKLEVILNGKPIDMFPGIVAGFSLENNKKIKHLILKVNIDKDMFVECLSPGKINLLVNRTLSGEIDTGKEISTKTFYFSEQAEKKLEYDETFYSQIPGEAPKRLKLSKKSLLKLMSDRADDMEGYMDANNLNPDNIPELIMIFDHYNQ